MKLPYFPMTIGLAVSFFSLTAALPVFASLKKQVLISQTVEHPALNSTAKGILDELVLAGFKEGKDFHSHIQSAQANMALAAQIASKMVHDRPDVVVAIGTLSAQSFLKYAKEGKINLIFSSVTDPVQAGLIKSPTLPAQHICGVSNFVDLKPQLEVIKKLQPNLKRLGIIYNPSEPNSISIIKKLQTLCDDLKIVLLKQSLLKTSDVSQSSARLVGQKPHAIFISNDNTALSSIKTIIKISEKAKIPLYVSDTDLVSLGAVAALGPNQYQLGVQTGKMIVRLLKGEKITQQLMEFPKKTELYLNMNAAKKVGLTIPAALLKQAAEVIGKEEGSKGST